MYVIVLPDSSVVGGANSFRMTIQTFGLNLANARYFVSSAFATWFKMRNIRGLRRAPAAEGGCRRPDFPEGCPVHDGVHPDIVP